MSRTTDERRLPKGMQAACLTAIATRLNPQKYSIVSDTKVQMIHFDLWSVERHP